MVDPVLKNKKTDYYQELLSGLGAAVYQLDLDNNCLTWLNDQHIILFGCPKEETSINAFEFAKAYFHPDDNYLMKEQLDSFRGNSRGSWSGVYRMKCNPGQWLWVLAKIIVYQRNADGYPSRLLGMFLEAVTNFETKKQMAELYRERIRARNLWFTDQLTARELEIIQLIAAGDTYKEIAMKLNIQPDTVNKHRKNVLNKLNLKNVACLVCFAKEAGLA